VREISNVKCVIGDGIVCYQRVGLSAILNISIDQVLDVGNRYIMIKNATNLHVAVLR